MTLQLMFYRYVYFIFEIILSKSEKKQFFFFGNSNRLHGRVGATYETASTRQFAFGRTETGRSLTNETKLFVETVGHTLGLPKKKKKNFITHQQRIILIVFFNNIE